MAIHYAKDGHIVTITIDRPEARNSLDVEHFGMLADCWVRFRDDDDAYVAILTGVGDVYCVGADLKKFVPIVTERADRLAAGESMQQVGESRYTMAHSLVAVLRDGAVVPETGEEFTLYKPVIAAINGVCAAGGLEMMWNTDLRVCADTAWFQLSEPRRRLDRAQRAPALVVPRDGGRAARRADHRAARLRDGARQSRRAARPRARRSALARRHDLLKRPARGARVQALGQGEHVPRAQGGARQRDELLGERVHERGCEGGHPGIQGEAPAGVAGTLGSGPPGALLKGEGDGEREDHGRHAEEGSARCLLEVEDDHLARYRDERHLEHDLHVHRVF